MHLSMAIGRFWQMARILKYRLWKNEFGILIIEWGNFIPGKKKTFGLPKKVHLSAGHKSAYYLCPNL